MATIKEALRGWLGEGLTRARAAGLPEVAIPEYDLEHPQNPAHGDYYCNVALKLARPLKEVGWNPLKIAQAVVDSLPAATFVGQVAVAPPGFINLTLRDDWLAGQVEAILAAGETYGQVELGQGRRWQVEFVSANPTGPLHVGHARGAVFGSTLANVLAAAGYRVEREFYVNDAGNQLQKFTRSLYARYGQALGKDWPLPNDGYAGDYVMELAEEIVAAEGDRFLQLPEAEALHELNEIGLRRMLGRIREDCERLGVTFDQWFSERSLYTSGEFEHVLEQLKAKGYLVEREGALWFSGTTQGEEKDNVVIRSSGVPTYFGSDIAYAHNKFIERGFDRAIYVWGADHHGHVARMKAVMVALGLDPDRLVVLLTQLVNLKGGRIGKRRGDFVTLQQLVDEIGADACRYVFLSRSGDSQMEVDLDLLKQQSQENPVYYIQYGHARTAGVLRTAAERGFSDDGGAVTLLKEEQELRLIRQMLQLPEVVELAAKQMAPHHLAHYASSLVDSFHKFYDTCRVLPRETPEPGDPSPELTRARLKLVRAAQLTLANTLRLMGMSAPERM